MHEFYRDILESHYGGYAPKTCLTIAGFYATLPPPDQLTAEFARERLRPLTPQTQWNYRSFLKPIETAPGRDLTSGLRPPKVRFHVQRTDLYTKNEMDRMFEACIDTRDRAMFQVLYESGMRATELTGLRIADIRPSQSLWWLTVIGKGSKERPIPILLSAPALQAWLDVHPKGEGAVFVNFRRPRVELGYRELLTRTLLILQRAEVRVRRCPIHLFRHTRATELASMGMSEVELCTFFG